MFSPVGADAYGAPGWSADQFRDIADEFGSARRDDARRPHPRQPSRAEYCDLLAGFGADILE